MAASSPDLTFLRADIKRQHEIAQEVSEEAEKLETLLKEPTIPPELKSKLEQSKDSLLRVARGLGANARAMSTSSLIVRWVVRLYALAVAVTLGYLIFRGIWLKEDTIVNISEIIKIAILPILTLVIGYYFGSSKAD
jgi:hypothetical protein